MSLVMRTGKNLPVAPPAKIKAAPSLTSQLEAAMPGTPSNPIDPSALQPLSNLSSGPAHRKSTPTDIEDTYRQLSEAAGRLNAASDELGKPIQAWEASLRKLNLGVGAWVELAAGGEDPRWWDRGLGYTKFKDRWCIALREREGDLRADEILKEEIWPFNEAPRWMRIEAIGKLPDLLKALLDRAEDTTKRITAQIARAEELAGAIKRAASTAMPQPKER